MVKGLGTVIYRVPDLDRAKAWYSTAFQQSPYFDQPFYVGFNIAGYELGLDPDPAGEAGTLAGSGQGPSTGSGQGPGGGVAYWRVAEIDAAVRHFVAAGASLVSASRDVGEGIKVATVSDPFGNRIGLIENPHFQLPAA
jgi:predicted enzyme related to lactoylglutathione lyase